MISRASAQPFGPEGNRSTGVVYRQIGSPFGAGEAAVELYGRAKPRDKTNEDGVYYLVVPMDVEKYQLLYSAPGYWAQLSAEPTENKHDPDKRKRVVLRKRDPEKDSKDLSELRGLLERELAVFIAARSDETRHAIRAGLSTFLKQLQEIGATEASYAVAETLKKM